MSNEGAIERAREAIEKCNYLRGLLVGVMPLAGAYDDRLSSALEIIDDIAYVCSERLEGVGGVVNGR